MRFVAAAVAVLATMLLLMVVFERLSIFAPRRDPAAGDEAVAVFFRDSASRSLSVHC